MVVTLGAQGYQNFSGSEAVNIGIVYKVLCICTHIHTDKKIYV